MTIYECAFHFAVGSNDYFNVVHYDITGDSPLDLQDLTDEIVSAWSASIGTITSTTQTFRGVVYRLDIDGSVGTEITPTGGAVAGTAANDEFAGQIALLVQKRTGSLVRPTLGRAFISGLSTSNLNSFGEWNSTALGQAETFWDGIIIVPFAGNGQAEMLLKASNPEAANTVAYNSVTECVALPIPSALQSRKKGRGA